MQMITLFSPHGVAAAFIVRTAWAVRLKFGMLVLACWLALPGTATAVTAQQGTTINENSIKRYMFAADSFTDVETEFRKRKLMISDPLKAPTTGLTLRVTAVGPSGYPVPLLVDNVRGRFHVYAERRRPQHPVVPLPYVTQEVIFNTPNPEVSPVGTLSYPKSGGPFPGVVLVAGSGPHTRDAGMSLHKTLTVLADHLTRQGFAVLRYDKRGVGLTGGALHPGSTTDDYAADALAAVRFLKIQPNILPTQIGIVGHSEGGIIAPMVAAEAPGDVGFVVMLAGTGLPGIDVKSLQDAAARRAEGMPESLVLLNQTQERELFEIASSKRSRPDAIAAMRAATLALPAAMKTRLDIPPEGIPDEAFDALLTPWFRRFLSLDPRTYLERVTCPVLALVGEKDLQVPPTENLKGIERALKRAATHATVRQLAGINHNLQNAKSGKDSEYFLIDETIAPSALALVSAWIKDVIHERKQAGSDL